MYVAQWESPWQAHTDPGFHPYHKKQTSKEKSQNGSAKVENREFFGKNWAIFIFEYKMSLSGQALRAWSPMAVLFRGDLFMRLLASSINECIIAE